MIVEQTLGLAHLPNNHGTGKLPTPDIDYAYRAKDYFALHWIGILSLTLGLWAMFGGMVA